MGKTVQIAICVLLFCAQLQCKVMDPICQDCLGVSQDLYTTVFQDSLSSYLTEFTLPGFSESTIMLDLRHLEEVSVDSSTLEPIFKLYFQAVDIESGTATVNHIDDIIIGTNEYEFSPTTRMRLLIYFDILEAYSAFEYLLRGSISLDLSYSNNRIPDEDSSYVFVVKNINNINLPKNKPNMESFNSFFLENARNDTSIVDSVEYTESTSYWSTETEFAVPYFPYFSNCEEEGNMIQITQILQNSLDCSLVPLEETVWINEFTFGSSATADVCEIKRTCVHEGEVEKTEYPEWQTLPSLLSLFSISQQKVPSADYSLNMAIDKESLVACKIGSSSGSNSSDEYPLNVKISMGYYQVSRTEKRIIRCQVDYGLYVSSAADFEYQLEISSAPLTHTYIMLSFGFEWYVYMLVFVMIGFVSNLEHLILWLYHSWIAEVAKPVRIRAYLRVIWEVLKGTFGGMLVLLAVIFIVSILMNGTIFNTELYTASSDAAATSPRVLWDYLLEEPTKDYDSTQISNLRSGRMGLSFAVIGILIIVLNCGFFIGKDKHREEYTNYAILGRVFKPLEWNTGKFLFGTFFYVSLQFFFIYFAYSTLYSKNIWTFIVTMKIIQMIMEEFAKSVYEDILPCLPLKIITDITAYLNTLSANDFYDFLFSFLVDVAMTMIEKAYVSQLQNIVVEKIQEKSEELNKFYLNLMNDAEDDLDDLQLQTADKENPHEDDNQRVFIYREVEDVEFIEEQIKEEYLPLRESQSSALLRKCQESEKEREIRRKYFVSLQKEYKRQRQLLFKDKTIHEEEKKNSHDYGDDPASNVDEQSAIFELLIDNIALLYTFFVQPFIVLILWITYYESAILSSYGISYNTVVLYNLSAVVIGVFAVINVILIFHILESYLNLSFEEQIETLLEKFYSRKVYWKTDDDQINLNLNPMLRGADHYCLSSQFFFILTIYLSGMFLLLLGMAVMFNKNYNVFDDLAASLIAIFWVVLVVVLMWLSKKLGLKADLWEYEKIKERHNEPESQIEYYTEELKQKGREWAERLENRTDEFDYFSRDGSYVDDSKKLIRSGPDCESSENIITTKHSIVSNQKKNVNQLMLKKSMAIADMHKNEELRQAEQLLQTICKKLESVFEKQPFRKEYALQNRQYIRQNIEKILPLVDYLPELQEFKQISSAPKVKYEDNAKKNETKNMDPLIADMVLHWLRATERQRNKRILNGLQYENKNKKCSFCYKTWGLYYGFGGICLECSIRMGELNHSRRLKKTHAKEIIIEKNLNVIEEEDEEDIRGEESFMNISGTSRGRVPSKFHQD